jgi:putative phosphoserine phosphatase/1-acylglycerol-3-phosphate O-acyltransferase
VIRNAEVIAARDSSTMNPGIVDVVVLPPIPTDDWTVDNLGDKIAAVRQLYLHTLKNWPRDEAPPKPPAAKPTKVAKKTPAKKAPAKKAPAKKTPAKKTPAKKAPAKKAPAKKATAKETR